MCSSFFLLAEMPRFTRKKWKYIIYDIALEIVNICSHASKHRLSNESARKRKRSEFKKNSSRGTPSLLNRSNEKERRMESHMRE